MRFSLSERSSEVERTAFTVLGFMREQTGRAWRIGAKKRWNSLTNHQSARFFRKSKSPSVRVAMEKRDEQDGRVMRLHGVQHLRSLQKER